MARSMPRQPRLLRARCRRGRSHGGADARLLRRRGRAPFGRARESSPGSRCGAARAARAAALMPVASTPRTVDIRSRKAWRAWLESNHSSVAEVWLVFHKRHTGTLAVEYEDAVEEALCFGWVDSLVRRLDADRFARKFTPRKSDSVWSESNRRRYAVLEAH